MAFNFLSGVSRMLLPNSNVDDSALKRLKEKWLSIPAIAKRLLEFLTLSGYGDPNKWSPKDVPVIEQLLEEALKKGPSLEDPSWFYDLQREIGVARFTASGQGLRDLNEMLLSLRSGTYIPPYPDPVDIVISGLSEPEFEVVPKRKGKGKKKKPKQPDPPPQNPPAAQVTEEPMVIEETGPIPDPDSPRNDPAAPSLEPIPDISVTEDGHGSKRDSPPSESTASTGGEAGGPREEPGGDDNDDLGAGLGISGGSAASVVAGGAIPAPTVPTAYPRPDQWLRDYLARYDELYPSGSRYPPRWQQLKKLYDKGMTVKEAWDTVKSFTSKSSSQGETLNEGAAPGIVWQDSGMASEGPGAPGNSAGGGGIGATLWASGAQFSGDSVITHMSRTLFIPFQQAHRYEPIVWRGKRTGTNHFIPIWPDHPVIGYKTPWFYLDVNAINRHFAPSEWQEVLERYGSIVPESMDIILSDFCVKDVSVVDGKTTVTDSGTGGVCVFADDDYKYPYVLGQSQNTLPGPLPTDIYSPPQYAYLTTGKKTKVQTTELYLSDTVAIPSQETAFYVLENAFYSIQRAGGGFAHSYTFPDLKPINLEGFSQHWMLMDNPLYPSRLWVPEKIGGGQKWKEVKDDDYGAKPLNWMPGPNIPSHSVEYSDGRGPIGQDSEGQKLWTGTSFGSDPRNRWSLRPLGVNQPYAYEPYDESSDRTVTVDAIGYGTASASAALGSDLGDVKPSSKVGRVPDDTECAKQGGGANTLFQVGKLNDNAFSEQVQNMTVPLMPGSVWQNRALHYESQIWAKIPDTDGNFMCERPALGGWGMHKPPPQIFLKMQPVPAPAALNAEVEKSFPSEHYLHQYAYCIMTVRMKWKTTPRTGPTRWNPQPSIGPPEASDHQPYILYDRISAVHKTRGQFVNPYYEEPEQVWTARGRVKHL